MRQNRKQIRLPYFDYALSGSYYITICSQKKRCIFSEINNDTIRLLPLGKILDEEWRKTSELRPSVAIDDFVIMPNHIHAIITLTDGKGTNDIPDTDSPFRSFGGSEKDSVSSIVAHVKSIVTKRARKELGITDEIWQRSFYEHIIRDDKDMRRIRDYIRINPIEWRIDHEHPSNP
jgi:REP element-mobilizing transposase RayT